MIGLQMGPDADLPYMKHENCRKEIEELILERNKLREVIRKVRFHMGPGHRCSIECPALMMLFAAIASQGDGEGRE